MVRYNLSSFSLMVMDGGLRGFFTWVSQQGSQFAASDYPGSEKYKKIAQPLRASASGRVGVLTRCRAAGTHGSV
jgi:hypothetical protein